MRDILVLRGHRVLLDAHLAALYGVTTKRLNEQVKRNVERFPDDFMFRLTRSEVKAVNRSQIATGSQRFAGAVPRGYGYGPSSQPNANNGTRQLSVSSEPRW